MSVTSAMFTRRSVATAVPSAESGLVVSTSSSAMTSMVVGTRSKTAATCKRKWQTSPFCIFFFLRAPVVFSLVNFSFWFLLVHLVVLVCLRLGIDIFFFTLLVVFPLPQSPSHPSPPIPHPQTFQLHFFIFFCSHTIYVYVYVYESLPELFIRLRKLAGPSIRNMCCLCLSNGQSMRCIKQGQSTLP